MTNSLKKAWEEILRPFIFRPKRVQVAALCYRPTDKGKDVLLVTSRDTGRWILPKGWPINGLDGAEAALQEAWEEAGVANARIDSAPVGSFEYSKKLSSGAETTVETQVYLTEVQELSKAYPEADERERQWVSPSDAANMVQEPQLQVLLRDL